MLNSLSTIDKRIRLRNGRWLAYGEYGDPEGKPIFYFHGLFGSRLERHPDESIATSLGVRIITIDRPGCGLSDFKPGRKLLDWPDDVAELANTLKIDKFAIVGVSGGGPYVLACAFKIPHCLTAAALISSVAPFDLPRATDGMMWPQHMLFSLAGHAPWLLGLPIWSMGFLLRHYPEQYLKQMTTLMPKYDQVVLSQPKVRAMLIEDFAEAFRAGPWGCIWETIMLVRPWGFRLEDIIMKIHLWQGDKDVNVPLQMGQYMASAIPNCHPTFCPNEGHLLFFNCWQEILAVLTLD